MGVCRALKCFEEQVVDSYVNLHPCHVGGGNKKRQLEDDAMTIVKFTYSTPVGSITQTPTELTSSTGELERKSAQPQLEGTV